LVHTNEKKKRSVYNVTRLTSTKTKSNKVSTLLNMLAFKLVTTLVIVGATAPEILGTKPEFNVK